MNEQKDQSQQNNQSRQNANENVNANPPQTQSTQTQQPQNTQTSQTRNGGGFPGFTEMFFPIFGEQPRPSSNENNPQQNGSQGSQGPQIQFFIYPLPGTPVTPAATPGGDGQATPNIFFFTPFFMPQQEVRKRASESAIEKLPIVTITKELVDSQASCPICLEHFVLSTGQEEKCQNVRQMPCNHTFCESCLFQWLRQNNSCPLCRKEIEAEEAEATTNAPPNIPIFGVMNFPLPTSNNSNSQSHSHSHSQNLHSRSSCALESVGCCEEIDNDVPVPIITLPQCHHRFHASCLRTSLLVEGYSLGDFNSTLNFRCPTCRSPAIVQSDVLKVSVTQNDERCQEQRDVPFNLPDDMDLD